MSDDALAEKDWVECLDDSRKSVVGRNAVGKSQPFFKPLFADVAKLFHEFVRLHPTDDAGESHEDNFTEMVKSVAAFASVLKHLEDFKVFGKAAGVVDFIGISRHPKSLRYLYIAYRLKFRNCILCFPCVGTLREKPEGCC